MRSFVFTLGFALLWSPSASAEEFGALYDQGRYREAIEAIDPEAPDAAILKGLALLQLGEYNEAEAAFGAEAAPSDENVMMERARLSGLARVMEAKGEIDRALELLDQMVVTTKRSLSDITDVGQANLLARGHSRYGLVALKYGRTEVARPQFRAAIDLVSKAHMKMHELGIPHDEGDPRMFASEATAGMAELFETEGDDRRAERAWRSVTARTDQPEILRRLIAFHLSQGNEANARAPLSRLQSLAEGKPEHRRCLALAVVDFQDDPDAALELAEADFEDGPNVFARDTLAWVLHRKGEHDRAAEIIAKALAVGVQDPLILFHAGMIAHARGESDEARRLLEQAIAINPAFDPIAAETARATLGQIR